MFLGAEVDVAVVVDMRLVAEIVVLHIVELVENAVVEHVREHVLLSDQPVVLDLWQFALGVDPTLAVVGEANPLMPGELPPQGLDAAVARVIEHHRRRFLLLQPADELLLVGVVHLGQVRILMHD